MHNAESNKLILYAPKITPRLAYIANTLFAEIKLTDSRIIFQEFRGVKINYSGENFSFDVFQIMPHGLLEETSISDYQPTCFLWQEEKAFFATVGDLPFDIFAASFFLLSRYEEYGAHEKDDYGRYAPTNSLAYKEGFLNKPLINIWLSHLVKILQTKFPNENWQPILSTFRFIPTYDIDEAYCYLHQPVWKNVLGFYKDLLLGKFHKVVERGNVYTGKAPDPFDTFNWLSGLHKKYSLEPIYFFLTIIKRGIYDRNIPAKNKALQDLYASIANSNLFGIHPSWQSGTEEAFLAKEIKFLQSITKKQITHSRFHYLRFSLPHSLRRLSKEGITDDFSMAYGAINGFRASYALPFKWYDLEIEQTTDLMIHPFCFMEASSFFHQAFSADEARVEMQYYYDIVKKVNGEFITLFHNHFLTKQKEWISWRNMYLDFLETNFGKKS